VMPRVLSPEFLSPAFCDIIWHQQARICSCLRPNDVHCCLVFLKFAQRLDIFRHHFEDFHCIPFDEKVLVNFVSRLHSEVDTFEICQVDRECSRCLDPLGLGREEFANLALEGVGLMLGFRMEIKNIPKCVPSMLELIETMR